VGRHLRKTARRFIAGAAATAAALAALLALAGQTVGAAGLLGAALGLTLGVCRALAAHDADRAEERWLRRVLADLDIPKDEVLPPLPPARPRRRTARPGLVAPAAAAIGVPVVLLAPPVAGAVALLSAVLALAIALPRLLAARDAPAAPLAPAHLMRF
jgi:hypothetical protein